MDILYIILSIVLVLLCAGINIFILMQEKRSAGLTGNVGGMGAQQTYWDKNKGRSREGQLEKYTKICAAAFMLIALALNIVH